MPLTIYCMTTWSTFCLLMLFWCGRFPFNSLMHNTSLKMVRHTLKFLLQCFQTVSDHFEMLCTIKGWYSGSLMNTSSKARILFEWRILKLITHGVWYSKQLSHKTISNIENPFDCYLEYLISSWYRKRTV